MPIYEYDCPVCGRFELIQKVNEEPSTPCPTCEEAGRKQLAPRAVSVSSFHLKGGGWYKTDYGTSGSSGTGKSPSSAAKSDSGKTSEGSSSSSGDSGSSDSPKGSCGSACACH